MYIQYVGFSLATSSRIYTFHVIGAAGEPRDFTVDVQSAAFRSSRLKTQDGPGICYGRLKQELERETKESPSESHLEIGDRDVQEYLERQYPRKYSKKEGSSGQIVNMKSPEGGLL
jgi:hypothetical protein